MNAVTLPIANRVADHVVRIPAVLVTLAARLVLQTRPRTPKRELDVAPAYGAWDDEITLEGDDTFGASRLDEATAELLG